MSIVDMYASSHGEVKSRWSHGEGAPFPKITYPKLLENVHLCHA